MFKELWKNISVSVAEATKEKLKELLEFSLMQKKPSAIVSHVIKSNKKIGKY
jgi:hypothetical protein